MSVVQDSFVGLREDSTGIMRKLVTEGRVALGVGLREVGRQGFQRLYHDANREEEKTISPLGQRADTQRGVRRNSRDGRTLTWLLDLLLAFVGASSRTSRTFWNPSDSPDSGEGEGVLPG